MLFHLFWIVHNTQIHLFSWGKRPSLGFNFKDFLLKDVFFKSLFLTWLSRVGPSLSLNFRIIWHFKAPVSLNSSNIFQSKSYSARLWSIFNWQFAEVPREFAKTIIKVTSLISIIWVVVRDFILIERQKQFFVHLGKHEAFPQIGNGDLVVSDISQPQKRIVSLASNFDFILLNKAFSYLSKRAFLLSKRCTQIFG